MFLDRGREVVISGAAGTGKSRACLEKLHYFAQRHNGARILIVRKTRESLNESALVTLERDVFQSGAPMLSGARRETRSSYVYPNGSEIIIAGLKQSGRDLPDRRDEPIRRLLPLNAEPLNQHHRLFHRRA